MDELSNQIELLRNSILNHYQRLDQEAIWFFVATIGCWSVTVPWIQALAMVLVWFYLFTQVFRGTTFNQSFGQQVSAIRTSVESSELPEENKDQLVGQLTRMADELLPFQKVIRLNYRFVVASIFFAVSTMEFIT